MIKIKSWQQILIGLALGVIAGLVFGPAIEILSPIGELFIRSIHMIIAPVIFLAIVNAICSIEDLKKMFRLSVKAVIVYGCCMIIAASLGLLSAYVFKPGLGLICFRKIRC